MNLEYFETDPVSHLVKNLFCLSIEKKDLPFVSKIIPVGFPAITYIYGSEQNAYLGQYHMPLQHLILTGQFDSAYVMQVNHEGCSFGMNFHPTALYKILGKDLSRFTNKHLKFDYSIHEISKDFEKLFEDPISDWQVLAEKMTYLLSKINLFQDEKLEPIDHAIDYIELKNGMLSVNDLLKELSFSQKTLEIHFKRIVGITPGKFIRLHRFTNLMRRYESQEIDIKDLFHMYDYYDRSHFSKDFKLFIGETPKSYFKKDFPLVREYLKED